MDAGSALLASVFATLAFLVVLALLRRTGRSQLEPSDSIGRRVSPEPRAAFVAGVAIIVVAGAAEALLLAEVWALTAWPIAPLQGSLMTLVQWPLAWSAVSRTRGAGRSLFLGMLAYGITLGMIYAPGI